ncbi:hypothetical protein G7054_g12621 [Neopestalotiopsis clavispora]|nr:hypothetical protein G7054_g12621 [Neopestalotiopsis clavispora]
MEFSNYTVLDGSITLVKNDVIQKRENYRGTSFIHTSGAADHGRTQPISVKTTSKTRVRHRPHGQVISAREDANGEEAHVQSTASMRILNEMTQRQSLMQRITTNDTAIHRARFGSLFLQAMLPPVCQRAQCCVESISTWTCSPESLLQGATETVGLLLTGLRTEHGDTLTAARMQLMQVSEGLRSRLADERADPQMLCATAQVMMMCEVSNPSRT